MDFSSKKFYSEKDSDPNNLKTMCPHCCCYAVHKVYWDGTKRCVKCTREIETERSVEQKEERIKIGIEVFYVGIGFFLFILLMGLISS